MSVYTLYMHAISGDIASLSDWRADEAMDCESWHGKPAEECNPENWIEDGMLEEIEIEVDDSYTARTNRLFHGCFNDAKEGEEFWDEWSTGLKYDSVYGAVARKKIPDGSDVTSIIGKMIERKRRREAKHND